MFNLNGLNKCFVLKLMLVDKASQSQVTLNEG